MLKAPEQKLAEDISIAEQMLAESFGGEVQLQVGETDGLSGRSYVHRLNVVHGPLEVPQTVILKQSPNRGPGQETYEPDALRGPASMLFNEWAGLQFLTEACQGTLPAPRFYGGNREAGFIVMEDFGTGKRLDHLLLADDPVPAEETLIALSSTVGRMHAQTIGQKSRYDELRQALGAVRESSESMTEQASKFLNGIDECLKSIDVSLPSGFGDEIMTVLPNLTESSPFYTYIHSDPCPDNCHWVGSDLRLLDFEHGRFGNALQDGVYPRIHFPSCWCVNRIPETIALRAEAAYRTELIKGCPQAADDTLFYQAVVGACAYWVCETFCNWSMPGILERDQEWGIATVRQRIVLRFEIFAQVSERYECLEMVGETARQVVSQLCKRWPDVEEMPYYPAFRETASAN